MSGDGLDLVERVATGTPSPAYPLTSAVHALLHALGATPLFAVRATSIAAGIVLTTATWLLARERFDDEPRRWATTALVGTVGAAALGFGSLEVYAPLCAATALYLWASVRSIHRNARHGANRRPRARFRARSPATEP